MNSEFFATLGQYVYKYVDDEGKILYIGKGNGDRCLAHIKDKGFSVDHCYIVARNLERFEDKKDWQSFLLESYLIAVETPENNSVSGHYKECFVMTSLSSMFATYKSEQYDMFETMPSWYIENYDTFRGRLREVKLNATTAFFLSNARSKMYMMWWWSPNSEDPIKVTFEINLPDGDELKSQKAQMRKWLKVNGHDTVHDDGKAQKFAIFVPTIDDVIELFNQFNA